MNDDKPVTLDRIKRHAKKIKKEKGIQHAKALDEAAVLAGFQNYRHAKVQLESTETDN